MFEAAVDDGAQDFGFEQEVAETGTEKNRKLY
jgi:hypothetical protein